MRILLVDDNMDLADSLADMLESEGHEIDVAYNGTNGIEKFSKNDYDLTLLDAKLPDLNGIEVFNRFNSIKPGYKIVVMTGFRVEQLIAYGTGEDIVVFRKPVFAELVLQSLNKLQQGVVLIADNHKGLREELQEILAENNRKAGLITDVDAMNAEDMNSGVLLFDTQRTILYDLSTYEQLKATGYKGAAIILAKEVDEEESGLDSLKSIKVTGCLFKPFHPQELIELIETYQLNRRVYAGSTESNSG